MGRSGILRAGLFAAAALCAPTGHALEPGVRIISAPPEIEYPEGVTVDDQGWIYVSSAVDSAVARMNAQGEAVEILSEGGVLLPPEEQLFPGLLGKKIDEHGRLWIMGGRSGKIFVLDKDTGELVAEHAVPSENNALNDAAILDDAVYVTDTAQPILWRLSKDGEKIGAPEAWLSFDGTPLQYAPGRNLNGIAADADGKYLIVIQMDKGLLFRIDLASKDVTPIDVGGEPVSNGDGLVLVGQTLYLVRQAETEVVTLRLAPDFTSAEVISRFSDPALTWPATAAIAGGELLVMDTQFNRRATGDPVKPFSIVAIPLELLGAE